MLPLMLFCAVLTTDEPVAKPTPQQLKWADMEIGMFIHFAPNTWQDQEGDDLSTPLNQINPKELDTDQWAQAAKNMGAKYVVLVTKHVGGFCLWQTDTTDYSIKNTPWKGGKGDVVADLAKSCKKFGLALGFYVSPMSKHDGTRVGGAIDDPAKEKAYADKYRKQLEELLTRYGPVFEVWFDGNTHLPVGDILDRHAPKAICFQGPRASIRWVGNEEGVALAESR
jgi:alpha-L-fucosidase